MNSKPLLTLSALLIAMASHAQNTRESSDVRASDRGVAVRAGDNSQLTFGVDNSTLSKLIDVFETSLVRAFEDNKTYFQSVTLETEDDRANARGLLASLEFAQESAKNSREREAEYKREMAKLNARMVSLEEGPSKRLMEEAQALFDATQLDAANALFAKVAEENKGSIDLFAEAKYQQGLIAELQFHVKDAAQNFETAARVSPSFDRLGKAIEFLNILDEHEKAAAFCDELVDLARREYGAASPELAEALAIRADIQFELANYRGAERDLLRAVAIDRAVSGAIPLEFGTHLAALGLNYLHQGRFGEAEDLLMEAIDSTRAAVGEDHEDYALRLGEMALLKSAMGEEAAALTWHLQALDLVTEIHGADSIEYAKALRHIAESEAGLGRWEDARARVDEARKIIAVKLGPGHLDTVEAELHLAMLDLVSGQPERFETALERALSATEHVLGNTHPRYARLLAHMGFQLTLAGDYERAGPIMERAHALTKAVLGTNSPQFVSRLADLALYHWKSGASRRGIDLQRQVVQHATDVYGPGHPETISYQQTLAVMLTEMGRPAEAAAMLEVVVGLIVARTGPDDPRYADALVDLSQPLIQLGRFDEAEAHLMAAKETLDAATSFPTLQRIYVRAMLAKLHFDQAQYDKAEPHLVEARDLATGTIVDAQVGFVVESSYGALLALTDRSEEAVEVLTAARVLADKQFGPDNVATAMVVLNLGATLANTGRLDEAEDATREALRWFDRDGIVNVVAPDANMQLAALLEKTDRLHEALPFYKRAAEAAGDINGDEHPKTANLLATYSSKLLEADRYSDAEAAARNAVTLAEAHHAPASPVSIQARRQLVRVMEAQDRLQDAISLQEALGRDIAASKDVAFGARLAQQNNLAMLHRRAGESEAAVRAMRKNLEQLRAYTGERDASMGYVFSNLAYYLARDGEVAEAEALYRDAIDFARTYGSDIQVSKILSRFGGHLDWAARDDEAEEAFKAAAELAENAEGGAGVPFVERLEDLAQYHARNEDFGKALRHMENALTIARFLLDDQNERYARLLVSYAGMLIGALEFEEAEEALHQALDIDHAVHGAGHVQIAYDKMSIANLRRATGQSADAERLLREAIEILEGQGQRTATARKRLAKILGETGRTEEATAMLRSLIDEKRPRTKARIANIVATRTVLADILLGSGDLDGAIKEAEMAYASATAELPHSEDMRVEALSVLIRAQARDGDTMAADEHYARALDLAKTEGTASAQISVQQAEAALLQAKSDAMAADRFAAVLDAAKERYGPDHPVNARISAEANR